MRRGVRFFYIMGVLIVGLAIGTMFAMDWSYMTGMQKWATTVDLLVWLSVGLTEIALAYLLDHAKRE